MTPTDLDPDEWRAIWRALRRMQLLQPDEAPGITSLTGGVSSVIVRVDRQKGPLCVKRALPQLKVAAVWEAPVERNSAEVAWMKVASQIVPHAVPAILGEDTQGNAFAMAYLEPADYPVWKAQLLNGHADPETARSVGRELVAIHAATADNPSLAARFANHANFYALRLEPYFEAAARKHPDCAQALYRLIEVTASTRRVLVHGDVSPKNILVGPQGPVFLDAECACYGDPAFDLAFCLNHLLLKSVVRPQSIADFLRCFDALALSYIHGVTWEAPSAFEARCAALMGGLLLARIDGKSPVEYITAEVERDRVRRVACSLLREPAQSLSEIIQRWSLSS